MIGSAYVCAAISLRLEPLTTSDKRYQTDTERAYAMFAVLSERMKDLMPTQKTNKASNKEAGGRSKAHEHIIEIMEDLKQEWEDTCRRAASSQGISEENQTSDNVDNNHFNNHLKGLVNRALMELKSVLEETKGRYLDKIGGLTVAKKRADNWFEQLRKGERLSTGVPPESTLRDALNAAWLCRIQSQLQSQPGEVSPIASAAYELCKTIIERPMVARGRGLEGSNPLISSLR